MKRAQLRQQGFATTAALFFVICVGVMAVTMLSLSSLSSKMTALTAEKLQANALAETGLQVFSDRIRSQMRADESYPFSMGVTALNIDRDGTDRQVGTYSAKLLAVRKVEVDIDQGGSKIRRATYTFSIEASGSTVQGKASTIVGKITGYVDHRLRNVVTTVADQNGGSYDQLSFPIGAIVSNGQINVETDDGLKTFAANGQDAHVLANQGMTWNPATGAKAGVTSSTVLDCQGQYLVPQGSAYDFTVSNSGIGNSNGSVNYRNPAMPAAGDFPGSPPNSVLRLGGEVNFADDAQVDTWTSKWQTVASGTGATTIAGGTSVSALPKNGSGQPIIGTPATINGDLDIGSGEEIRLVPNSSDPKKNIIVVKGNIKNLGKIRNLGVTLVVEGKYSDSASSKYMIDNVGSPFGDRDTTVMRSAFISVNKSPDAVVLKAGGDLQTGLIYAAKGGIQVLGNAPDITGSLVSGGYGANGGIKIKPSGGTLFSLHYDPYATTGGPLPIDPDTVIDNSWVDDGISASFTPSRLFDYRQLK